MKKITIGFIYLIASLLASEASAGPFQSAIRQPPPAATQKDTIIGTVYKEKVGYRIEVAYKYASSPVKKFSFTVPRHNESNYALGKVVVYQKYANGKIEDYPVFLGLRMVARSVFNKKNDFIWLSVEFNKLKGVLRDETNLASLSIRKYSFIKSPQQRLSMLQKEPRLKFDVPILTEESGTFYIPASSSGQVINYDKLDLSLKIRVRKIRLK